MVVYQIVIIETHQTGMVNSVFPGQVTQTVYAAVLTTGLTLII